MTIHAAIFKRRILFPALFAGAVLGGTASFLVSAKTPAQNANNPLSSARQASLSSHRLDQTAKEPSSTTIRPAEASQPQPAQSRRASSPTARASLPATAPSLSQIPDFPQAHSVPSGSIPEKSRQKRSEPVPSTFSDLSHAPSFGMVSTSASAMSESVGLAASGSRSGPAQTGVSPSGSASIAQASNVAWSPSDPGNTLTAPGQKVQIENVQSTPDGPNLDLVITPIDATAAQQSSGGFTHEQQMFRLKWGWVNYDLALRAGSDVSQAPE